MDTSHDAAAIVGRMAGLDTERREPLPPAKLIRRYCTDVPDGLVADPGIVGNVARGFCGFDGRNGYDDGYSFMGDLESRGWRAIASKGDWPYVVYLWWAERTPERDTFAVAEYCEADLTVWTFGTVEAARAHVATLRDCP